MFKKIYYYIVSKMATNQKTKLKQDTEFDNYIKYESVWL